MEDVEETETAVETRKTRSGRSLGSAEKRQPGGRKTRKKVVMIEVEVSDEDVEKEVKKSEEEEDETNDVVNEPVLESSDNAVEADDMHNTITSYQEAMDVSEEQVEQESNRNDNEQFEDSNSVTNDFNSFKGAESSSDVLNNESNSCFDAGQENGQDSLMSNEGFMERAMEIANENDNENKEEEEQDQETEKDLDDEMEKMEDIMEEVNGQDSNEAEELNKPQYSVEGHQDSNEPQGSIEPPQESNEPQESVEPDEFNEPEESNASNTESKLIPASDPDAENISEDELPSVQAVKVPETEEVSDEELPGPKRAELPADTEVVSEDELETEKKNNKRKIAEGDYDPGSPTSDESALKKQALEPSDDADELKEKPKKLPELDKYWKAVNDDPTDFTGWTYLLQYVDQENDMEAAREAYDAFLSHYPYCYGYWRKYADYEKRKGNKKRCEEVFERGLKAIPLSVDLWIHYLTYVRTSKPDDEDFVRMQFERSLASCGLEFRSDRLWENYIKWETEGKRLQNATLVYERLLATPTQGYLQHFDNFQEHVLSNPPNKILEVDEFLALRKEVKGLLKQDAADVADNPDVPPGEDSEENTDEETKAIRERIISIRRKIHKNTSNAVTSRWNYEEGIKRPYFHVKPLERCQLKNWQEYLDHEIAQGDRTRIIVLFERCLIACALYEEFWMKFVHYLQELKDDELQPKIKDVFERACTIHHLKKPNVHLQWAMFEESIKNYNKAAEILQNLEKTVPNLLQVAYRRINLERRRGDFDKCCTLFEHYIANSKNKMFTTNLAVKYSRFTLKMKKDVDKALDILNAAVAKDSMNPRLYLQLIDVTMQKETIVEEEVLKHIDAYLEKENADNDQKVLFAQRKLEFLEDFGSDIFSVQSAYEELQKYLKHSRENVKKKDSKSDVSKKDKNSASTASASNSYSNYGSYSNSPGSYQYGSSQQGTYGQYPQYGQSDQYQYSGWGNYSNYSGYNQWGSYGSGYSY